MLRHIGVSRMRTEKVTQTHRSYLTCIVKARTYPSFNGNKPLIDLKHAHHCDHQCYSAICEQHLHSSDEARPRHSLLSPRLGSIRNQHKAQSRYSTARPCNWVHILERTIDDTLHIDTTDPGGVVGTTDKGGGSSYWNG